MMLGLTMRMMRKEYPGGRTELRDAIACDWPRFMSAALPGESWVLVPNSGAEAIGYAERLGVDALLFSGGDDWGVFPPRDQTEELLFAWAKEKNYPLLGVCRGAQIINMLLGGSLRSCRGHTAARHGLALRACPLCGAGNLEVNSFHNYCMAPNDLAPGLEAFALAADGSVEAFHGDGGKLCGLMWHPEREEPPAAFDLFLLRKFYGGYGYGGG